MARIAVSPRAIHGQEPPISQTKKNERLFNVAMENNNIL